MDGEKCCSICHMSSNVTTDTVLFGDWMQSSDIQVHYFCLLCSTNLQQKGKDCSGILGFLLRDIRSEIRAGAKRNCCYCNKPQATIQCITCKQYFHLMCGHRNGCVSQFVNEFPSYCDECVPETLFPMEPKNLGNKLCHICKSGIKIVSRVDCITSPCCGEGPVHKYCLQRYSLAAGYYLKCLWCRGTKFREQIPLSGIFVPDRDAQWEHNKETYKDLHRGHKQCDMELCLCPKGRNYIGGKWQLIICQLCGSVGAHNPMCIPGKDKLRTPISVFKCNTCSGTEKSLMTPTDEKNLANQSNRHCNANINMSVYICKQKLSSLDMSVQETPNFSEDESHTSSSSSTTVIPRLKYSTIDKRCQSYVSCSSKENEKQFQKSECLVNAARICPQDINKPCDTDTVISSPIALEKDPVIEESQILEKTVVENLEQSPVVSSTTENSENPSDVAKVYKFDEHFNCLGTAKLRIDPLDSRFTGLDITEILNIVTLKDLYDHSHDIEIFAEINAIIAEYSDE